VIADGPIQPMQLMSPTSLQSGIVSVINTAPTRSASTVHQHQTHFGDAGSNGQASAMQPLSPLSLVHKPSVAMVSPSMRKDSPGFGSASAAQVKPPMLAPKVRDQVHGIATRFNVSDTAASQNDYDDDDVYNYPRPDLYQGSYKPPMLDLYQGSYQQDDETYDTPPMLKQRADPVRYDDDETYDLPPKAYRGYEAENDEIYDVPSMGLTNIASDCQPPPPSDHDRATLYHSYVNAASLAKAGLSETDCSSDVNDVHRLVVESDVRDAADEFGIAVSERTRSFKSSQSCNQ